MFDKDQNIYQIKPEEIEDYSHAILDIREYDVPYYVRVCIDNNIRSGSWYVVKSLNGIVDVILIFLLIR